MRGVFVTGTDTGVGKTRVGTALARCLVARGVPLRVRKPVESGCEGAACLPQDAIALRAAAGAREPLERVCGYRLRAPLSPERAAALEGIVLTLAGVSAACTDGVQAGDFVLVEGAGGFCSPLAADALNADLAMALGLPVLLVGPERLGAIHQVLVCAEAIARRGLVLAGVVLNRIAPRPDADPGMDNRADLVRWLGVEPLILPHVPTAGDPGGQALAPALETLAARLSTAPTERPA